MSNELDRRKGWWNFTTTQEYIDNRSAIDYIYKCETLKLLKEILKELKKGN